MGRRRPEAPWVRAGQRAVAGMVGVTGRAASRLPSGAAARIGAALGELAYWAVPGRRRVALDNLALAFGSAAPPATRRRIARTNFRHLGVTAMECCRLFLGPPGAMVRSVRLEGVEHGKAALAEGRGLLYLTAHFGNWELLAAAHPPTGLPPLHVDVRPL